MRLQQITPELSQGKGWARLIFKESTSTNELKTLSIVRPRHVEPFLGKHGWQISESRMPLRIEKTSDSDFSVLLGPATVQHLEVASNYEFVFFNDQLQTTGSVIVRWHGISYRSPKGEISPIEVIQIDSGRDDSQATTTSAPLVPIEGWGFPTVIEPPETAAPFPAISAPSSELELTNSPSPVITSTAAPAIRQVKCLNPGCAAKILDNMRKCPFCGTSR
jgi:hypothetical protein